MALPPSSALPAVFYFWKNGVLTSPSSAPTIVAAYYPDFSLLTGLPLSLTATATGVYTKSDVFTALQATQSGDYSAIAYTSDTTMDNQVSIAQWQVGIDYISQLAANVITAASIATDAITEIQAGLATSTSQITINDNVLEAITDIAAVQVDTDNIQTRIPTALVNGHMSSSVQEMGANTLTASALATSAVTEIQTGLSTLTAQQVWEYVTRTLTALGANVTVGDFTAAALAKFFTLNTGEDFADSVAGSVVREISGGTGADPWGTDLEDGGYTGDEAGAVVLAIKAKTDTIGGGVTFANVPVGSAGETTLVRGSSYYNNDGLALLYTLSGYPVLTNGAPCYWRAYTSPSGEPITITGVVVGTTQMRFELSDTNTTYLVSGKYALSVNSNFSHLLRTPNDTLTILESVQ